uniref:Uncharacterized protein n=1 Tax=Arundo donax TaxID=35708 RepID=A0A0A9EUW3_ARUDO
MDSCHIFTAMQSVALCWFSPTEIPTSTCSDRNSCATALGVTLLSVVSVENRA